MAELREHTPVAGSHGEETNRLVYELLEMVQHPNTDSRRGRVEALFCIGDEAARKAGATKELETLLVGLASVWLRCLIPVDSRLGLVGRRVSLQNAESRLIDRLPITEICQRPSRQCGASGVDVRQSWTFPSTLIITSTRQNPSASTVFISGLQPFLDN